MYRMISLLKNARGQSITELALMLPFILLLIGGVLDFGLVFLVSHVVENAAREGARRAAVSSTAPVVETGTFPACQSSSSKVLSAACNAIPNAGLFSGFTVTNSGVTGATPNRAVTIQVSGPYNWILIPGMLFFFGDSSFGNSMTITRSATMRWEWQT